MNGGTPGSERDAAVRDGSDSSLPERPRAGEVIEGMEVLCPIAAGGMGEVYRVRRVRAGGFEKRLALKVMHPHLARDGSLVAMFLDEARIAAQVAHPNVVEVFDTGVHRGLPWIAMELIDGCSLLELCAREDVPRGLVLRVLAGAAAGLHAAHEARDAAGRELAIVHRDVSPHNILVTGDGRTKVVDFGIAAAHGRLAHTATGELKGKVAYLAPEQLGGGAARLSRKVDVWAFGVTAWECVRGLRLFDADETGARLRQIEAMPIPSLEGCGISSELVRAIDACLIRDPARRPPSLEAIRAALDAEASRCGVPGEAEVAGWMRARSLGAARHAPEAGSATTEPDLDARDARGAPDDDVSVEPDDRSVAAVAPAVRDRRVARRTAIALAIATLLGLGTFAASRDARSVAARAEAAPATVSAAALPAAAPPATAPPVATAPAAVSIVALAPQEPEPRSAEPDRMPPQVPAPIERRRSPRRARPSPLRSTEPAAAAPPASSVDAPAGAAPRADTPPPLMPSPYAR